MRQESGDGSTRTTGTRGRAGLAACLAAALALVQFAPTAFADEPRVIVLRVRDEPPVDAFVAALRVQVGSAARVEVGPLLEAGSLASRMEEAAALGRASDVALVVWVEYGQARSHAREDVVFYAVDRDPNDALIGVASVPHADRPEDHRVLALKVGHLLDLLLADPDPAERLERAFVGTPRPSPFAFVVELSAAGAIGTDTVGPQLGLAAALGLAIRSDELTLELAATMRWMSSLEARNAAGVLQLGEIDAGFSARGTWTWDWFRAGVDLEIGARVLDAYGTATDGRTDSLLRAVPVLAGGLEARARVFRSLELRVAGGVELALVEQRFSIAGVPVANLGRARPFAGLSLVVSMP